MKELDEAKEAIENILCNNFHDPIDKECPYCRARDQILSLSGKNWKIAIINIRAGVSRGDDNKKWRQVIWEGGE